MVTTNEPRRSQESDESDLDATHYLLNRDGTAAMGVPTDNSPHLDTAVPSRSPSTRSDKNVRNKKPWLPVHISSCGIRSRNCCYIVIATCALAWAIIASAGLFGYRKYRQAPPDGLSPPWYPTPKGGTAQTWVSSYEKASKLVEKMTLAEKVNVTTGTGWMMGLAVGTTGPATLVGFPQLLLQDGPLGIRFSDNTSAFPAGITVGATWSPDLMYARGKAHGEEARAKGIHVLLGPCIGPLGRMPAGGRNWEGFGADPYLQGIAAAETIRGIQSQGVMATIKHLVANEQEHFRQSWEWGLANALSTNIDDRSMHELYVWPFYDAVHAGVAGVMCSYNMVNNSYACSNSKLLNGILKDEIGFQGFVVSDWLAQRSGVASALAGLDVTMPGDGLGWADGKSLWGPEMSRAVLNGSLPIERLNDMVTRVVAAWYQLGQDADDFPANSGPNFSSWTNDEKGFASPGSPTDQESILVNRYVNVRSDHDRLAHQVAVEGIVLLKNTNALLPLSSDASLNIGLFGEDAGPGNGPNYCKDRACNQGTLGSGWGSGAVEFPYLVSPIEGITAAAGDKIQVSDYSNHTTPISKVPEYLNQDICMVFANADSGEGYVGWDNIKGDRNDLFLQKGGDDLIIWIAEKCRGDTIVIIHSVGPVVMERWIENPRVRAVLYANLPGQESGHALADVVFGEANPSGHLPYTIGKKLEDYGPGAQIMYVPNGLVPQQDFSEGIFVDYRYFQHAGITPRFPFGFGLSYTTFKFSNFRIEQKKAKSSYPAARPEDMPIAPSYASSVPDKTEVLFPTEIRRLEKYVYPYLDKKDLDEINYRPGQYSYPEGHSFEIQPALLSDAGGDEGGNPDLWAVHLAVSVDVTNTGDKTGKAVPQLYITYPEENNPNEGERLQFAPRSLRGFAKMEIRPGEMLTHTFNLTRRDLSYWDVVGQNWKMVTQGVYKISVAWHADDEGVGGEW